MGGGIKGEKVNISLLTNQSEHSALMGAAITVKHGENETQYVWEGVGITVTIPPYEDYEVSVSGVEGYKTPEVFTATAQADNARSLNFEYKAERVKVTLSAAGGADMTGTTVNIYGQEYTFSGTPIEVLVPFDEVYSVQGGAFGSLVAPLAQSFTASIPLREINLEYRSCVLVVNMLSNQVSDATIAALKASVEYGSTTLEVTNGVMVDIPSDTNITITFPDVEDYVTPEPITFTSVTGLNEKTGTYLTEKVTVNVSASDGASVEGQVVTVVKKEADLSEYIPANGVYIQSVDGMLYTESEWDGSKTPNGVAVVTDECSFVIALNDARNDMAIYKDSSGALEKYMTAISNETSAKADYNGATNTTNIIKVESGTTYAAGWCNAFSFPSGKNGFLPSLGQMWAACSNKSAVDAALTKAGGTALSTNYYYWTSTFREVSYSGYRRCWVLHWRNDAVTYSDLYNNYRVRAFATLIALKQDTKDETHEVTNSQVTFKAAHGTEYSVSVNDKTGYKTPAMQSYVADSVTRNVSMMYEAETVTVNVSSSDNKIEGYEVTVSQDAIVGDTNYIPLEYIESTGTQWIDTGFTPNQDTSIYMDVIPTTVAAGVQSGIFFGSSYPVNKDGIEAYIYDGNFTFEYGGTSSVKDTKSSANVRYQVAIEKNVSTAYLNGEEHYKVVNPEVEFTAAKTLHLCSLPREAQHFGLLKIFSCQIYDNETLVRDYIPVKREDGIAGLYDLVEGKFYPSNGSGNFVASSNVGSVVIGTQNSVTGTYKIPYGQTYTVSASPVDGYSTPVSQTFTASQVNRVVDVHYQLSGLKLNILSNQANDTALANVKALVTYGSNSVELGNGETLGLSANTEVTITFPDVPDYKTPEPITFTHTSGYSEKTGTYLTEKVTVDVSANDGASVDGQVVSVMKRQMMSVEPDYATLDSLGVAIMDIDGNFYADNTAWKAAGSPTPNGVAVSDGVHRFCVAMTMISNVCYESGASDIEYWGALNKLVDGVFTTTDSNEAMADFNGVSNTDAIVANVTSSDNKFTKYPWSAAGLCRQFTFPNGTKGYLGSVGEWKVVYNVIDKINNILSELGGATLQRYTSSDYWTSTQRSSDGAWYLSLSTSNYGGTCGFNGGKAMPHRVRAFSTIEAETLEVEDTEDFEVTNGEVTFKAAHGTEYSVSVNDKTGYKTPASKSFTAQLTVNNVSMEYQKIVATDLSKRDVHGNKIAQTTANCYVVSESGDYMIPIAYGAAIKNGQVNAASFTNNGGANSHDFVNYLGNAITSPYVETDTGSVATSVQMSISDTENAVTNLGIINGDGCKYISFSVPSVPKTGANAVISVKDADGVIMWSWHIWLWEDDLTPVEITNATSVAYNIMPVNLGSKWDEDAKTHIKNWFYQFGRPTPLLCPSAYNSASNHASYGALSYAAESIASNIQTGIKNPAIFFGYDSSYNNNWFKTNSGKTYNLWDAACTSTGNSDNNVVKTIYDPCPIGFKMPNGNTFTGFNIINKANGIVKFTRYSGDSTGVGFPMSGYRRYSDGLLSHVGSYGFVWLSSAYSQGIAYGLDFDSSYVYPEDGYYRAYSFSVRPVTDTGLEGQTKLTVTRIDQTITDPEAMITRIVDLGGIEAVRANSHRYTGTVVDGVMQLKQLNDTNGTKYLDGSAATLTTVGTDVWMKLPQFYWKCVQVQTDVFDFYVAYGAKPDDTYNTWDGKDLIGAYEAYNSSSKLYSVSGQVSTGKVSQADFKTYSQARGEGFTLVKWKHHCMMAMLYYAQYSNTNCQAKIGIGTNSYTKSTGTTNSLGMTDTVAGGNGDSNSINFWGLENWWGNKYEWIDNVVVDARVWKVTEDDGTVRQAGTGGSSDKWTSKLLFGENIDLIPTEGSGSETTGFCDYYNQSSSNSRMVMRSSANASTANGVAYVGVNYDSSRTLANCGSRLAYRGDYQIID